MLLACVRCLNVQGCHIIFSGCWQVTETNPYSHPVWLLAEALGAECSLNYDPEQTTHVVRTLACICLHHVLAYIHFHPCSQTPGQPEPFAQGLHVNQQTELL